MRKLLFILLVPALGHATITATVTRIYSVGSAVQCDYALLDDADGSSTPGGTIQVDQGNPQDSITTQLSAIVDQANIVKSLKPLEGVVIESNKQAPPDLMKPVGPLKGAALSADSQAIEK